MRRSPRDDAPSRPDATERTQDKAVLDRAAAAELGAALRAAWSPTELDPAVQRVLVEAALTDPLAPATPAEEAAARELGEALDARARAAGDGDADELALATALRAAFTPEPPAPATIDRVLAVALRSRVAARPQRPPGRVAFIGLSAVTGALALAATIALALTAPGEDARRPPPHLSRSTAGLFESRFEIGQTSARIDRIASVRERELRDNRFANWGVP